ncbi:hypothetical protein CP533_1155 [Ophiocordyceps camponoti-saundersi (nom. inval.)]|nr:hypothetical protein CP533_1155 [Ophiocordyceps camponoti-saundersi (nom. inval.)]
MEPSSKKRKLAPKVNASPAANVQPAQYARETQPAPPAQQQQQQPSAAHNEPLADRQDFESFAHHLQEAALLIHRQYQRTSYVDVSVLLLSWEGDGAVSDDVATLEQVFQKEYHYDTQSWQIPTVPNPSIKLGVHMASFLEHARPDHLLIIYYSGHGYVGSDGQLYWACNTRDDAVKLKWECVRCLLEDAQSDILLLLDTCAMPDAATAGSHGIKQAIAAYSAEHHPQPAGSSCSFTLNLAESLRKLVGGLPFTVQRLHDEIMSQQLAQAPQAQSNGASVPPPDQSQLPIFFNLTPGKGQKLTLAPLSAQPLSAVTRGDVQLIDPDSVADVLLDETRTLVCTTIMSEANPNMARYNAWLQNTPPLAAKISVEGLFLGPPTLLLISMPHWLYTLVQYDKICCSMGPVSSHNMLHLYQKVVGPAGTRPSAKEVEDGRILLEARELAAVTPSHSRKELDNGHDDGHDAPEPLVSPVKPIKPKEEVEDSVEIQVAAEQLKALSHMRHRSDEGAGQRPRTSLPNAVPRDEAALDAATDSAAAAAAVAASASASTTTMAESSKSARVKAPRRFMPKQETRCNHCSHAPFKDSSSLRKHIAAAHTRPFPCAFSFAGCTSTFGSKNEWKRHIASQHLCLQYYRCSECPQGAADGKGNEFNRKDLFTQHLRRMHAPFHVKRAMSKGDTKLLADWEESVKSMQQSCLVTRRQPPQRSACPKPGCQHEFSGAGSWDEWTEHVGRHMEKGEAQSLGIDGLLARWALDEGIIEVKDDGEYRLCAGNGFVSSSSTASAGKDSSSMVSASAASALAAESSRLEDPRASLLDARPAEHQA